MCVLMNVYNVSNLFMKTLLACIAICLLINNPSFAQVRNDAVDSIRKEANQEYIERYKENRELSYTSPFGEIGAPAKIIIEGRLTTTYLLLASKHLPVSLALIPDFTVKVLDDRSAGVRTPSLRLGAAAYVRLSKDAKHYKYAELAFTHHSNGQDGNALNPDGTINTYNGNFNTNYITALYRFGNFQNKDSQHTAYSSFNHRAGVEIHKGFSYEPVLKNDYGFTRILYSFSFRRYKLYKGNGGSWKKLKNRENDSQKVLDKELFRMNADLSYAVNPMVEYQFGSAKKRLNAEFSFNYSMPFMQNAFLMASVGYYGEDPYNIYYRNQYTFIRLGISSGFIKNKIR